jgi:ABC-type lipoprotein release transport system permease subunit
MRAVSYLAAHELRTRWRGWAVLVVLVAVAGGAVLAAAAGARRTNSAYPRFLQVSKASDLLVSTGGGLGGYYRALARLPGAAAVAPFAGLNGQTLGQHVTPVDHRLRYLVDIPKVLAGRLPRPDRPGEIALDQHGAATLHVQVGSTLAMEAIRANGPPGARKLRERVVGVVVTRSSVKPVTDQDKFPMILVSAALMRDLGPSYIAIDWAAVRLKPGTTLDSFRRRAEALARRFPGMQGNDVSVVDEHAQAASIERAIRPEAVALALFALVFLLVALLVVGQVATRLLAVSSSDNPVLAALGMTRGQLMASGLIEVGVAAAAGAVAAIGVAVAASPLMPIGTARLAEPAPGISIDTAVLAVGAIAIPVLLVARAAWPAWRLASARGTHLGDATAVSRRPLLAGWVAGAGAPVTMTTGVRLALEPGRGRTAVPARGALAGTMLSVLAVTAAVTFGANLVHVVDTPRLYGQSWDTAIDLWFRPVTPAHTQDQLGRIPAVSGWTFGNHGIVSIGGVVVPAIGLAAGRGPLLSPTLLEGRPPRTDHEIVLGTSTLRRIGRHVGQAVTVTVLEGRRLRDRIVGRAVFPNIGRGAFTPTDLGQGAQTTAAALQPLAASATPSPGFEFVLVRFTPGQPRAAAIAGFQRSMAGFCQRIGGPCLATDQRPNGITSYARIDGTPGVLAALLAILGAAVLGQFAVVSGRRRRRDFAILKALGLFRRQVSSITAWQVSTLTGLALLVGLPLGIVAGRWAWALFAHDLGIPAGAITPLPLVLLMVPAVILIANTVAFWPARTTARLKPAEILRAE